MSKPPAKAAAATKAPAKAEKAAAAPKPAPAPAVAAKLAQAPSVPAKAVKASPKPALPARTGSKAAPATTAPAAKPAAKTASPTLAPYPNRPVAKSASAIKDSAKTAANTLPTPAPAPQHNRFTDRFAPARAPAKTMTETADMPRAAHKADPKLASAWKHKPGRELTEDELLAMPDGEYMNDKQLDFFRARLQQQKDDLLSNAGETTEHLREDTSIVPDPADRATIEEEHALELRTRDRERKLLKKIAQSMGRLDTGEYGYCDETGEPIGLQRLLARPTATLSLEAQQRRELKQKMFGD